MTEFGGGLGCGSLRTLLTPRKLRNSVLTTAAYVLLLWLAYFLLMTISDGHQEQGDGGEKGERGLGDQGHTAERAAEVPCDGRGEKGERSGQGQGYSARRAAGQQRPGDGVRKEESGRSDRQTADRPGDVSGEVPDDGRAEDHSPSPRINTTFHTLLNRLEAPRLSADPTRPGPHNLTGKPGRGGHSNLTPHTGAPGRGQIRGSNRGLSASGEKNNQSIPHANQILWNLAAPNFTGVNFAAVARAFKEHVIDDVIDYAVDETSAEIRLKYPSFQLPIPRFINARARRLFFMNKINGRFAKVTSEPELTGIIKVIKNGSVSTDIDCGWTSNLTLFQFPVYGEEIEDTLHARVLVPILVPDGDSFQHFIDGVLPKIVQVLPLLRLDGVALAIYDTRNEVALDILLALGIRDRQLVMIQQGERAPITADVMINTCVTPPLHPVLSRTAQALIGVPAAKPVTMETAYVILLTRARSNNPGRNIKNMGEVVKWLRGRYGENLVLFRGDLNLAESIAVFSRARVLIGVHGGAFYNVNFCTRPAAVVELMPTEGETGEVPNNLAHSIMWRMSAALGLQYWRIPYNPLGMYADVIAHIPALKQALDQIDKAQLHVR